MLMANGALPITIRMRWKAHFAGCLLHLRGERNRRLLTLLTAVAVGFCLAQVSFAQPNTDAQLGTIRFTEDIPGREYRIHAVLDPTVGAALPGLLPVNHCASARMRTSIEGLQFEGPVKLAMVWLMARANGEELSPDLAQPPDGLPSDHPLNTPVVLLPRRATALEHLADVLQQVKGIGFRFEMIHTDSSGMLCPLSMFTKEGMGFSYRVAP